MRGVLQRPAATSIEYEHRLPTVSDTESVGHAHSLLLSGASKLENSNASDTEHRWTEEGRAESARERGGQQNRSGAVGQHQNTNK